MQKLFTPIPVILLLFTGFLLSSIAASSMLVRIWKKPDSANIRRDAIAFSAAVLLFLLDVNGVALCAITLRGACIRGASGILGRSVFDMAALNVASPEPDAVPGDLAELKGCIVVYYKYGCPDCADVHDDLVAAIDSQPGAYVVYSGTEDGKRLLEAYPVEQVPSGVYVVKNDPTVTYIAHQLYIEDRNNPEKPAEFDADAWARLVGLQEKGR